jgi:hypothetical protein
MDALIAALLDPGAYPHPVDDVQIVETHISTVLLAGEFAYKIKKPVSLGFLDFSTLEARRHFCFEELRINRRFAPRLYLDVVAIARGADGRLCMAGEGELVEVALRMRRFPAGELLAEHVAREDLPRAAWRTLGRDIAALHETLPRAPRDDNEGHGLPAHLRDAVAENFRQVRPYLRELADLTALNAVEDAAWLRWRRLETLLQRRYEAGEVRECHGDLHLGNLVMIDGRALPFDAIEFNARLRWIDRMSEIAFLLMDCEARSRREGGMIALNAWLESSGDYAGLTLLDFFRCYRAMVRAKVALLATRPPAEPGGQPLVDYRRYAAIAASSLAGRPLFLAITCGVSGSGKSTIAEALAARLEAIRVRSDVERKRLFGLPPEADTRASGMPDIYGPQAGERTFARLAELAETVILAGYPVIVDATFMHRPSRDRFRALAARLGVPFHVLLCSADPAELRRRVESRQGDASEAGIAVLESQLAAWEPPDASCEDGVVEVVDRGLEALAALLSGGAADDAGG